MNDQVQRKNLAKKSSGEPKKEYQKVRIKDTEFCVGDTVQILVNENEYSYGTIERIWWHQRRGKPKAEIRAYFKPKDLFENTEIFSEAELFDSNLVQTIDIESIEGKVLVLEFQTYYQEDYWEENIFFSRAKWNTKTRQLEPPIKDWMKVCICNQIFNPDKQYSYCDKCGSFFHSECVEEAAKEGKIYADCPKCPEI
ncbi:unnamed protein product [Blepharisma stoltei]|uniref:BAH domain-containing protein n=1 Tax=Blepharisma stoltei TaxID=1481888 RepID=A0AAU9J2G3_9CILI|nr:unnamed protein product [Blepharisma stoltei]